MTTWNMKIQTVPFGSYSSVDLDSNCLRLEKLVFSYSAPHYLQFSLAGANHTAPLPRNAFIILWDSDGQLPDGTDQDQHHPIFEGFLEDVRPGDDGITVNYTAYDPTRLAAKAAPVMSAGWSEGDIGTLTRPQKAIGAVPRLVLNCANDADDDYAFARNGFGTAGQLIAGILEDQYQPLYWCNAAPGDGTNAGNGIAYVWSGEVANLVTEPQEKIVHESSTIRAAITQILTRFYPDWRMYWQPGARLWRFAQLTSAPQVEFTLNDPASTYKILGIQIEPTTEGCFGAVEYRGPETLSIELFSWVDGDSGNTLVPLGSGTVLEVYTDSSGSHDAVAYTQFQIVNPAQRRGGKLLPTPYQLVMNNNIVSYRSPVLQLSFDFGETWTSTNTWFDHYNGIVYWDQPVFYWSDHSPAGSTQHYFPPNAARLLWAPYIDPITVRAPGPDSSWGGSAGSFIGTYSTVGNVNAELCQYDEALAVGYEYGQPVTTSYRKAQFQALVDSILYERKDIVWAGHIVLNGLVWDFAWLGKRINITALDPSGNPLTTGWESINAWLTDVDYDLIAGTTTLSLSSDQMANLGWDAQLLKDRLNIKALQQVEYQTYQYVYRDYVTAFGNHVQDLAAVVETNHFDYVDAQTGNVVDSTG